MANLLKETITVLQRRDYIPEVDVVWIGNENIYFEWEDFVKIADKNYDASYGAAHVARDLIVCLVDGSWLTRGEYDGSEWWQYHKAPKKPEKKRVPPTLIGGSWPSLHELMKSDNDEE